MARLGLVLNRERPSRGALEALGLTSHNVVRVLVADVDEYLQWAREVEGVVELCALVEGQTVGVGSPWDSGDWSGFDRAIAELAGRPHLAQYGEIFNELDIWEIPAWWAAQAAIRAAPVLARAGIQPILSSVASGQWQDYLGQMVAYLPDEIRGLVWANLHPYGQRVQGFPSGWGFGELDQAMRTARNRSGLPVCSTESGIKVGDAGGEDAQAEYVRRWCQTIAELPESEYPFACYFAWLDTSGQAHEQGDQAFGLVRADGSPRPALDEFRGSLGGGAMPTPSGEFIVGPGVLELMRQHGDVPGSDELYHPIGAPTGKHQYSETFAKNGARYVYLFSANKSFRFSPTT